MSERVMAQVVLWSTVVLGVVGAVLGAAFFTRLDFVQTLIVISFCGLLGIALALLGVGVHGEETAEPHQFAAPRPMPQPVSPPPPPPPASSWATALPAPAPTPEPARPANTEWWNQTAVPASSPPAVQTARKAVPLTDFDAHRAQIAQCPRCAGFELDLRRDGQVCAFTCRNPHCRNTWEWRPGTAWPPTVVRHNLSRATPADEERR